MACFGILTIPEVSRQWQRCNDWWLKLLRGLGHATHPLAFPAAGLDPGHPHAGEIP